MQTLGRLWRSLTAPALLVASTLVLPVPVSASAVPDAPVLTFTSATASAIRVSWTAPASNGSPITRFELRRGETLVSSTITAATLTFNNTGLAAGTGYSFTLKACNTFGCSAASTALTAATIPVAATALVGTPGNTQVSLAWTNSVSPAVTGYKVSYRLSTVSTWTEWTPGVDDTSPTVITGLSNASAYVFKVAAYNASGVIDSRASSNVTPRTVPSAPTIAASSIGATGVTFAWSAPASNGAAVSSFKVFRGDTLVATLSGTASKATVSTLTAGTEYSFKVQACNVAGCSADSNVLTVPTLPASTALITPTPGDGQISVAWTSSVSPVVSAYQLQYKTSAAALWSDWTAGVDDTSPTVVTGLVNGTGYVFRVVTVNASGSVVSASTTASIPRTLPGTPVLASPVVTASSIALTWTAPASGGMPITSYQVYVNNTINQTVTSAKATLSGLTSATVYAVKVRACTVAGCGPFTSTLSQVTKALPVTVSSVKADSQVTLTWSNATGTIDAHKVFFKVATVSSWTEWTPGVSDSSPTVVTGLVNGVTYNFMVAAVNDAASVESRSISVSLVGVPPTAPAQPTSSTVTAVGATVAWVAPSNTGGVSATGYQVWVNGLLAATTASSARTYAITGQASGETHTVQIKVCNVHGCSPASSARSFTTRVSAPTGLSVTNFVYHVRVTWDASSESSLLGYRLYYKEASAVSWTTYTPAAYDTSPVMIYGLPTGKQYAYRLAAVDAAGEVSSGLVIADRPTPDYQEPPTDLTASPLNAAVSLSWTAAESNGASDISDYTVEFTETGSGVWEVFDDGVSTATSATVTGLTNGIGYGFRIRGVNDNGSSLPSSSVSSTPRTVPGAATSLTLTELDGEIEIDWSAPSSNGGSTILGYLVEFKEAEDALWEALITTASTSATLDGLYNGEIYNVRVTAYNVAGYGVPAVADGVPYTAPGEPADLTAVAGSSLVTLSWDEPYDDGGDPVSEYKIRVNDGSLWTDFATIPASAGVAGSFSFDVTGLTAGLHYEFQVGAVNGAAVTYTSEEVLARPFTVAAAPGSVVASSGSGSVTVSWSVPASDGWSTITGFEATATAGGNLAGSCTTTSTTCTITGLSAGTEHTFSVRASNAAGWSAPSSSSLSSVATPYTTPTAPTEVWALAGDTTVDLYWSAPTNNGWSAVSDYIVQYSADGAAWTDVSDEVSITNSGLTVDQLTNGTTYRFRVAAVNAAGQGAFSTTGTSFEWESPESYLTFWESDELSAHQTLPGVTVAANTVVFCSAATTAIATLGSYVQVNGVKSGSGIGLVAMHSVFSGVLRNRAPYRVVATAVKDGSEDCFVLEADADVLNSLPGAGGYATFSPFNAGTYMVLHDYSDLVISAGAEVMPHFSPTAPRNVVVSPSAGEAEISWSEPVSDNGLAVLYYNVYATPAPASGSLVCEEVSSSSCVVTGLTNGVTYSFDVYAYNAYGESPSSAASAVPFTTPSYPLYAMTYPYDSGIAVSWSAPASNGGAPITSYQLESCSSNCYGGGVWTVASSTSSLGAHVTGLTNGQSYFFRVRAANAAGLSQPSTIIADSPYTTASAPTIMSVTPDHQRLTVTWSIPSSDGGSSITGYQYSVDGGAWLTATSSVSSATRAITGLTNGVAYSIRIRAVTSRAGGGVASSAVSGTPQWYAATVGCSGCSTSSGTDGGRNFTQYVFTGNGTFSVTNAGSDGSVQYLIVGGGAGGATQIGNGSAGGSGGVVRNGTTAINSNSTYTVTVGAGGTATNAWSVAGNPGGTSYFGSLAASGGCGGTSGGCGGWYYDANGDQVWYSGGNWSNWGGGGGAGAGASGSNGQGGETGGNGGNGRTVWGSTYGGGGGGGGGAQGYTSLGGTGGGGNGRGHNAGGSGSSAPANTGGGGGGGYYSAGDGGSGIVIVRVFTTVP